MLELVVNTKTKADPTSSSRFLIISITYIIKSASRHKTLLLTAGFAGTLPFMAPEAFKGVVSTKLDVWSLGILLYVMLYGKYPFNGN